jgi:hypothetical protein
MSLSASLRVEKQTERPLNKTNALRRQEWTPFLADFLEGGHSAGAVKDRRQKTEFRRQETGDRRQETGDRRQETGDRRQENPELQTPNSKLQTQFLHLQLRCSPHEIGKSQF